MKMPINWKPILVGLVAIATAAWQTLSYPSPQAALSDPLLFQKLLPALLVAALGFVAKQHNVTGGQVGQPSSPQALFDANQHPSAVNVPVGPAAVVTTTSPAPDPSTPPKA